MAIEIGLEEQWVQAHQQGPAFSGKHKVTPFMIKQL